MYNKVADIYCKDPNLLLSVFNEMVESGMNEEEALSRLYAFCPTKRAALYLRSVLPISWNNIFICPETRNSKDPSDSKEIEKYIKWIKTFDMKFDYIIQNPPYNGSLHLDFLEKGLDLLTPGKGRMVIIEPAMWLINLNPNSTYIKGTKTNHTPMIKNMIEGHVESVAIENFNKEFGTDLQLPFATTTIDMSRSFEKIKFTVFGETRYVDSIYDCNLIGNHNIVLSILNKVKSYGDFMSNHVYDLNAGENWYYLRYIKMCAFSRLCGVANRNYENITNAWKFFNGINGTIYTRYSAPAIDYKDDTIQNVPYPKRDVNGKDKPGTIGDNIFGKEEELKNWKHFIYNNKLPIFINIVLGVDQNHNNAQDFLPWLTNKQYTDEEINKLFGFTEEEIALIDRTLKKYERNSPWFRRYLCGPDAATDEEVNNFIKSL